MSSSAPQRRPDPVRGRTASYLAGAGRVRLAAVPRLRSRAPRVPFVMLVSLLLLAGVVGLLLFNTSMQQASFTAQRLDDQADVLAAREQALSTQLQAKRSPERLKELACERGMVQPAGAVFLDARTGKVTGKPVPAAKSDASCSADPLGLEGKP